MKKQVQSQSAVSGAHCTCRLTTAHGYPTLSALIVVTAIAVTTARPDAADPVALEVLLDRAAWYLDYFIDRFQNVVAEEQYIQDAATLLPTYSPFTGRGGVAQPPSTADSTRARHTISY